jgi:hypothetical protein
VSIEKAISWLPEEKNCRTMLIDAHRGISVDIIEITGQKRFNVQHLMWKTLAPLRFEAGLDIRAGMRSMPASDSKLVKVALFAREEVLAVVIETRAY